MSLITYRGNCQQKKKQNGAAMPEFLERNTSNFLNNRAVSKCLKVCLQQHATESSTKTNVSRLKQVATFRNKGRSGNSPGSGRGAAWGSAQPPGGSLIRTGGIFRGVNLISPPSYQCGRSPVAAEGVPSRLVPHHVRLLNELV